MKQVQKDPVKEILMQKLSCRYHEAISEKKSPKETSKVKSIISHYKYGYRKTIFVGTLPEVIKFKLTLNPSLSSLVYKSR